MYTVWAENEAIIVRVLGTEILRTQEHSHTDRYVLGKIVCV